MVEGRPDIEAMHAFVEGKIRSVVWNKTILPLIDDYVRSWSVDDRAERRARDRIWIALADEAAAIDALAKEAEAAKDPNNAHHHTEFDHWLVSNYENHGIRREGQFEAVFVEHKDKYWLSIWHGNARILYMSFQGYYIAMNFADNFLAGILLDGRCFDPSHHRSSK
jgi:hypothetical protein